MKNKNQIILFILAVSVLLNFTLGLPVLEEKAISLKKLFVKDTKSQQQVKQVSDKQPATNSNNIFDEINPLLGYSLEASYGNLGPKMIAAGVIDPQKFKDVYAKSGKTLTDEQERILLKGFDENIVITRDNSYFLLNFFWAVGLANKTKILTEGDMVKYGGLKSAGGFASTGGWTLAKSDAMDFYSKSNLIPLTPQQEELVRQVASNIFRPCCNNSTAFPDCNHGMALLGILELMASNNATEEQMYRVAKYVNAFWFPGNYYDLAVYFKNKENKSFEEIDPKTILSKEYSSASGVQRVKKWMIDQGLVQEPPKSGGGCGV